MDYQLAQINVASMIGASLEDPVMHDFNSNLDRVNALAESSPGFIWRWKEEAAEDPFGDPRLIVNISVWESVEKLEAFTYKTFHSQFVRRRKEWFRHFGQAYYALWWVSAGQYPTVQQCKEKLDLLQKKGPSPEAFNFKQRFPAPIK